MAQHRPPAAGPWVGSAPTAGVDDHEVLVHELSPPVPAGAAARPSARRREVRGGRRDPADLDTVEDRAAILGVDHAPRIGTASSDRHCDSRGHTDDVDLDPPTCGWSSGRTKRFVIGEALTASTRFAIPRAATRRFASFPCAAEIIYAVQRAFWQVTDQDFASP